MNFNFLPNLLTIFNFGTVTSNVSHHHHVADEPKSSDAKVQAGADLPLQAPADPARVVARPAPVKVEPAPQLNAQGPAAAGGSSGNVARTPPAERADAAKKPRATGGPKTFQNYSSDEELDRAFGYSDRESDDDQQDPTYKPSNEEEEQSDAESIDNNNRPLRRSQRGQ